MGLVAYRQFNVGLNQGGKWPRGGIWLGVGDGGHLTEGKWPIFDIS